jgi:hypothetical protein
MSTRRQVPKRLGPLGAALCVKTLVLMFAVLCVMAQVVADAAVITDLNSYVLFATGNGVSNSDPVLSFKGGNAAGRGLVYGGNVGVNKADPNLNNDPAMIAVGLNGDFIMQSGYQLVGDSIRLGVEAVVYDVFTNKQVGTGWGTPGVVNGVIQTFTAPLFNPMPPLFSPFSTSSTTDIDVATNTTYNGGTPLIPGDYRDLSVKDNATIYLTAGTYTFRRLNTGQSFNIYTVPGTIFQVTGDTDPNTPDMQFNGNGSFVGSAVPGVESVALFHYLGTDVQFSDSSTFYGVILAPDAQISLGRAMDHYGRFIGGGFNSDFNDNIWYRDVTLVPEPSSYVLMSLGMAVTLTLTRWRRHRAGTSQCNILSVNRRWVPDRGKLASRGKDRSANGTSASVGRAGWIMRSSRRSWLGRMRPDRGGAAVLPIHAQGRICLVGADRP